MDEKRAGQYRSKIGYVLDKMYAIPEDAGTMDDLSIDGVLYRVQTSIDAAVDMVCDAGARYGRLVSATITRTSTIFWQRMKLTGNSHRILGS